MEIEITEQKNNALLKRKEIKFRMTFAGATPNREDVRSKLVAMLNSDKSLTVLDYFKCDYGRHSAQGYAKVYASAEAMKIEPEHKLKRNFEARKEEAKVEGTEQPKEKAEVKKEAAEKPKENAEGKKEGE